MIYLESRCHWHIALDKETITGSLKVLSHQQMGVFKNNGTPKSSILIWFSTINHPLWGTPIFGNTQFMSNKTEAQMSLALGVSTIATLASRIEGNRVCLL